jgi:cell division protein FtsB
MVRSFLIGFYKGIHNLLLSPTKVIWLCVGLVVLNLVIDGSLLRLWSLHRDRLGTEEKITALKTKTEEMKLRLKRAKDPAFLEREARDRFDLVSEGDLVFVFSEEEEPYQ